MKQICKTNGRTTGPGEVGLSRKSGRRPYETMSMTVLETASANPILAASVVTSAKVQSVGQEVGYMFDLNAPGGIDENTGKTFSHEWNAGGTGKE